MPATAVMSITATKTNVKPRISGPRASGISSVKMMRQGPAPTARAASITPGWMVTRFCSTMRETPNAVATASGTTAAVVPRKVPTTSSVRGAIATSRITNGIGRTMFTAKLSAAKTARFARSAPARVVYSATPSTRPSAPPIKIVRLTM